MRLVFMGSDPIALPLLDWLAGEGGRLAEIAGVFTQPDRPAGRGQKAAPNAIKRWAQQRLLPVFQPERIGEPERRALAGLRPDVSLVMAYGHILRDDFIGIPAAGTLNLHASLLPAYRGASPIQAAIAAGDRKTGVTLMRIVQELDAGPVAGAEEVGIGPEDTAAEVEAKLAAACVPLLRRCLPALAGGALAFIPQDASCASFCRKLTKADGVLDFEAPAEVLAARINALMPWPGCGVDIGGERIRFGGARVAEERPWGALPGEVVPASTPLSALRATRSTLRVAAGTGVLEVTRLQRAGGRMLEAGDFLRGFPIAPGTRLASTPMPVLSSARPFKH